MAKTKLDTVVAGQHLTPSLINKLIAALKGQVVGRNTIGAPARNEDLGTSLLQWDDVYVWDAFLNLSQLSAEQIFSGPSDILSGNTRLLSGQPNFITPDGSAASFVLAGVPTPLAFKVNDERFVCNAVLSKTGLTLGPSATHTCLVNDAKLDTTDFTRLAGDENTYLSPAASLIVDTMGATMSGRIGRWASFKIVDGGNTEYFYGFITSTTLLSHLFRGHYYDSAGDPLPRIAITNNDVITLLETAYVYLESDGLTINVAYTDPVWSFATPAAPATNDRWYDLDNQIWKSYNGSSFVASDEVFLGQVVIDSSACIAARCAPFFFIKKDAQSVGIERVSSTDYRANPGDTLAAVRSGRYLPRSTRESWVPANDFAAATDTYHTSVSGSFFYYLYLGDTGERFISDFEPIFHFREGAFFHPHHAWRCIGKIKASSGTLTADFDQFLDDRAQMDARVVHATTAEDTYAFSFAAPSVDVGLTVVENKGCPILISSTSWTFLSPGIFSIYLATQYTRAVGASNALINYHLEGGAPADDIDISPQSAGGLAAVNQRRGHVIEGTISVTRPYFAYTLQAVCLNLIAGDIVNIGGLTCWVEYLGPLHR